eukprot:jgi/Picre1/33411/NNA_008735.t1
MPRGRRDKSRTCGSLVTTGTTTKRVRSTWQQSTVAISASALRWDRRGAQIINRSQRHRKRNTRIFGDEWDNSNEDGGEHVPPVDLDDRDVCAAWWPARRSVLHQVGRCASTGRKQTKKPLTCVGEIEKHLDENADPNKQGPSARRRVKRKQVVSSEDEWLPHDESQETIVDAEDDNILLLPEEWTNENHAGGLLCVTHLRWNIWITAGGHNAANCAMPRYLSGK